MRVLLDTHTFLWHSDGNSFPSVNVGQVGGSALGPCNAFGLGLRLFRAHGTLTTINSEVDRVYMDTTSAIEIHDTNLRRKIIIKKEGSASTVVWNPWIAKAKAMPDFPDDAWTGMMCVETCNVGPTAVTLSPGQTHRMTARVQQA